MHADNVLPGASTQEYLLLAYLADKPLGDVALASSARSFMLCRMFTDHTEQIRKDAGEQASWADSLPSTLSQYHMQASLLQRGVSSDITTGE